MLPSNSITTSLSVWMIFQGKGFMRGTPAGRQCASGSSLGLRCLVSASAQGCIIGLPASVVRGEYQTPERSGFPLSILGAGPDGPTRRLFSGLPSGPTMLPPGGGSAAPGGRAGVCARAKIAHVASDRMEMGDFIALRSYALPILDQVIGRAPSKGL